MNYSLNIFKQLSIPIFLFLSLLLVCAPRFDRNDFGPVKYFVGEGFTEDGLPFDAYQYITYTKYFRGDLSAQKKLENPFTYRPVAPFIASFLPFKPMTSINVLNVLALLVAIVFLNQLLKFLKFKSSFRLLGLILFIYSFPTFYYGSSGNIDSVLICCLMIGLYTLLKKLWILLLIIIIISTGVKETSIVIVFVSIVYILFKTSIQVSRKITLIVSCIVVYSSVTIILRKLFGTGSEYIWLPEIQAILENISRPKTWLSFILTLGIPGFMSFFHLKHLKKYYHQTSIKLILLFGFAISILLFVLSIISAYADGRFIWVSYPFTIPLSLYIIMELQVRGKKYRSFQKFGFDRLKNNKK